MQEIAAEIIKVVEDTRLKLGQASTGSVRQKPAPGEWCKQEILGHLVDSAANNLQRIVRGALGTGMECLPYDQTGWVALQHYQGMDWAELVELWSVNQRQLCRVIAGLEEGCLENPVNIGRDAPVTVRFVIVDYLRHLKLHVGQLVAE
jgi:hypothetical protein